ncbi:MAG: hypothetical protein NW215_15610 [Hyphomicrobiales bacterium]|nr:hypothetical protein [Hyphomicrobiales bacterium]
MPGHRTQIAWRRASLAAALALGLGGCAEGLDVNFNAPILEAAGINLSGKKPENPDVPERAGIVIPPSKDRLPEPGARPVAAATPAAWPNDPDLARKTAEREAAEKELKYCREGDWSGKGGIEEFNRTTNRDPRCRAQYVKDMIKRNEAENAAAQARINAPDAPPAAPAR